MRIFDILNESAAVIKEFGMPGMEVMSPEEFTGNPEYSKEEATPEEAGLVKESAHTLSLLSLIYENAIEEKRQLPVVPQEPLEPGTDVKGRELSDEEMEKEMERIRAKQEAEKRDKPYIHRSNLFDEKGNPLNVQQVKDLIKQRPANLLRQNSKLEKSGGGKQVFYNLSLPAIMGLVVDEKTNKFKIVNTCPSAGACKVYCYATKGGYIQWKASSLSQTRILNFLLNDPEGFKAKLMSELAPLADKKDTEVFVRWHDAGDFFSEAYLNLAFEVARALPSINFYAYTKRVGMVSGASVPKNFLFNFSKGATHAEEQLLDPKVHKSSIVVPEALFDDLVEKVKETKVTKTGKEEVVTRSAAKSPEALETLKQRLAAKYNIPLESILSYDEMARTPVGTDKQYNVIVMPGDGDASAARKDVLGTYLLMH